MERGKPVHAPIPGLGMRTFKTAVATFLTAFIYLFTPRNPTFACIGAVFGLGMDKNESILFGGNRFFGTLFGGLIGLFLYWVEHLIFPEGSDVWDLLSIFIGVYILVIICCKFKWAGGVQPGAVVLCIILFNTPAGHIKYTIDRIIDTGIGVLMAFVVNGLLTRQRVEKFFHISPAND